MRTDLEHVGKRYGDTRALADVTISLSEDDQVVVLIGPSGGGKSTLLRLLGGLETADEGALSRNGIEFPRTEPELREFRRQNGFLFQAFNLFPHLSALENIVLPLVEVHHWERNAAHARAEEVVERFGMKAHLSKRPAEMSGGQQQRIALARAMAHSPATLLLDEPTSALDPEMKAEVLDLIEDLCRSGQRIVLSTHEMGFARQCADTVVFLSGGRVEECGPAKDAFDHPRSETVRQFLSKVMKW